MAQIEVRHLSKTFISKDAKVNALKDINLEIERGDIYGIIGMSGAGKSTLVRCLNYLEKPTKGEVLIDGRDLGGMTEKELLKQRKDIAMIFQHFNLLMQKNVVDNVSFPLLIQGVKKKEARKRAKELLGIVGLEEKELSYPAQLSGGQKQRVAIARALASDPRILLCDEATSALDPKTTNSILELLLEINQKIGITIVIVTHQMEVVRKACNKACILEQGRIADEGTVRDIFIRQPLSLRRLLGEEEIHLPACGHNIQIAHMVNDIRDGELFGRMSKELDYVFPILDGKIQEYQNDSMGIFVINVDDAHLEQVTRYLDEQKFTWREIKNVDKTEA